MERQDKDHERKRPRETKKKRRIAYVYFAFVLKDNIKKTTEKDIDSNDKDIRQHDGLLDEYPLNDVTPD
jgi:hypothetical protein